METTTTLSRVDARALQRDINFHMRKCGPTCTQIDLLERDLSKALTALGINGCGCALNDPLCAVSNVNGRCRGL